MQLLFWQRLYARISPNRIRALSLRTSRSYEAPPLVAIERLQDQFKVVAFGHEARALPPSPTLNVVNPFAHPRTIISDFTVAEMLLTHAIKMVTKGQWSAPFTELILHPEGQFEGGLTQVEYRALNELCVAAGCRRQTVYEGRALTNQEVSEFDFKQAPHQ